MNIFYLDDDPIQCAKWHVDKHIVKMITEYCQLLSTAHRILDGQMYYDKTKNGRNIKRWMLSGNKEDVLFKATHVNHPSNVWTRESLSNYMMLFKLYMACIAEYKYRYGKVHGSSRPSVYLQRPPKNIPDIGLTEIPQAMPDYCKVPNDPISGYRNYYISEKSHLANWKNREKPLWI